MATALQSCDEKIQTQEEQKEQQGGDDNGSGSGLTDAEEAQRYYVNTFLLTFSQVYYLWADYSSVRSVFNNWKTTDEPVAKVREMRYKNYSTGKEIDKWTQAISDYTSFTSSIGGTSTTYGYDIVLMYADSSHEAIVAIVKYASLDSPAAKAGIKRGDAIVKVNGQIMTPDNYANIVNKEMFGSNSCTLTMYDGREITLQAVEMYEDPVHYYSTFSFGGKKVGYLVFNSFTKKARARLYEAFSYFKEEGISELILDLRYNGGGYVSTEEFLASLLAPVAAVSSESLYSTTVYNLTLTEAWGNSPVNFASQYTVKEDSGKEVKYDVLSANPDIKKIYAIISSGTASASEAVITGLMPYVDIDIIGEQSHGKYCTGLPYSLEDFYDSMSSSLEASKIRSAKTYGANWGIYVMIGRYADKDGKTPCMPDGFVPDFEVSDNPVQPYQFGDENEAMLHAALVRAGKTDFTSSESSTRSVIPSSTFQMLPDQIHHSPAFGMRLDDTLVPLALK